MIQPRLPNDSTFGRSSEDPPLAGHPAASHDLPIPFGVGPISGGRFRPPAAASACQAGDELVAAAGPVQEREAPG